MKVSFTIEYEGEDAELADDLTHGADLGVLLRDALGEFIATRTPVEKYVSERYTNTLVNQKWKVRDVEKRIRLAELVKRGDLTIHVDETDEEARKARVAARAARRAAR